MDQTLSELGQAAVADLGTVLARMPDDAADPLIEAILAARRIAIHGLGREGLAMKGFAMRLFHMGRDVHVVGDMTTPPLGPGDLLIVSAGPGDFRSIDALLDIASNAGAKTAVVTAEPEGATSRKADVQLAIPAQTMASDQGGAVSLHLPQYQAKTIGPVDAPPEFAQVPAALQHAHVAARLQLPPVGLRPPRQAHTEPLPGYGVAVL